MSDFATYTRSAAACATLRDRASSELGRARLARECADWLELALLAAREAHDVETPRRLRHAWALETA